MNKLRGLKGTPVTISVLREGWTDLKDYTLVRDIIKIKAVHYEIIDTNVGYVRIKDFSEQAAPELEKALTSFARASTPLIRLKHLCFKRLKFLFEVYPRIFDCQVFLNTLL